MKLTARTFTDRHWWFILPAISWDNMYHHCPCIFINWLCWGIQIETHRTI